MNKLSTRLAAVIVVMMTLTILYIGIMIMIKVDNGVMVSKKGCCTISFTRMEDDIYRVMWHDNSSLEAFTQFVYVEYPNDDMTNEEQLQSELEWAIEECKEMCYTMKH
jgi:hypothetical protein